MAKTFKSSASNIPSPRQSYNSLDGKRTSGSTSPKKSDSPDTVTGEEEEFELTDIRDWPNEWSRNGVTGERIRNCIIYCLDHKEGDYFRTKDITVGALNNPKFVKLMDEDTPPGWTPEKAEKRAAYRKVKPFPKKLAEHLMTGPGVNAPIEGFATAMDKMGAAKRYWHGNGGESQPNPDIDIEEKFKGYVPRPPVEPPKITQYTSDISRDHLLELFAEWEKMGQDKRYRAFLSIPEKNRKFVMASSAYHRYAEKGGWTPDEIRDIASGSVICPVCSNSGVYRALQYGAYEDCDGNKRELCRDRNRFCDCGKWKHIFKVIEQDMGGLHHFDTSDLWGIKPHTMNRLPIPVQQREIEYLKQYRNGSFLFHGPAGVGKTTFAVALYRDAFMRSADKFWSNGAPNTHGNNRWIWRVNFNTLLQEYNAWLFDRELPEPYVTQSKIAAITRRGFTPFLAIEEVDKVELNSYRIGFLFNLLNEVLETRGGQVVMTTNLNPVSFVEYFTTSEEYSESGWALIRRLTDTVHVRNYFEYF